MNDHTKISHNLYCGDADPAGGARSLRARKMREGPVTGPTESALSTLLV